MPISEETRANKIDYKQKYSNLKRKLKILIYENECHQEELRKAQRQLLQVSRDKAFLLDRLIQYENIQSTTSDSEDTLSSDSEAEPKPKNEPKRKKTNESVASDSAASSKKKRPSQSTSRAKNSSASKQSKPTVSSAVASTSTSPLTLSLPSSSFAAPIIKIEPGLLPSCSSQPGKNVVNFLASKPSLTQPSTPQTPTITTTSSQPSISASDGHMTSEQLERHLESRRQQLTMLMPEKTPLTVPVELFSNESSSGLPDNESFIP